MASLLASLCQSSPSWWQNGPVCTSLDKADSALLVNTNVTQLIFLWFTGALLGWMLPRPAAVTRPGWASGALSLVSTQWRRAIIGYHGFLVAREVWYHFTCPGTFRRLGMAILGLLMGKGWHFDFPTASQPAAAGGTPCDPKLADKDAGSSPEDTWYVGRKDLDFYKRHVEQGVDCGAGPWEVLMQREIPGVVKYVAYRRTLPSGKTEYKTITLCPDASAHEFMDLYMDDDYRPNWDTMIIHHEVLEHGDFDQRQQVVRWIRRFPFSFISDREYVIAKRLFLEGDAMYGVTKAVDHVRAPANSNVVRCDVYYSMWCSRTVPCPWGTNKPACETVLLHHEQMKIPENLARFAVKHGMWGFVRKLSSEFNKFVDARRLRVGAHQVDPNAYGAGNKPNPPLPAVPSSSSSSSTPFKAASGAGMRRTETSTSALSSLTTQSSDNGEQGDSLYRCGSGSPAQLQRTKSGRLRGLATFALASGFAMLLTRSSSTTSVSRRSTYSSAGSGSPTTNNTKQTGAGKLRRVRTQSSVCVADPTLLRRTVTSHAVEAL